MLDWPTSYQRPQFLLESGCAFVGTFAATVGDATGMLAVGVMTPRLPPGGLGHVSSFY